jgi:uncharacterized RDD family membrane protein YckC
MTNAILGVGALVASLAIAFFVFVGSRSLIATLFRVPDRLPPFGEAPAASYKAARTGARFAIAAAGPLAIYLCAAAITTLGLLAQGEALLGGTRVNVVPSRPAHEAGMLDGDQVISINGAPVSSWDELSAIVRAHPGEALDIAVMRGERELHVTVTPGEKGTPSEGKIGVIARPDKVTIGQAVRRGLTAPLSVVNQLREIFVGSVKAELAGPVGIVRQTARAAGTAGDLLTLMGVTLSANVLPYVIVGSLLLVPLGPGRAPSEKEDNKSGAGAPLAPPRRAQSGRRLWARILDWIVANTAVATLVILADAELGGELVRGPLVLLLWIPLEALLLSTVGSTPGKWLLGIFVRDAGGRRLSFRAALRRSAGVFAWGLGLGSVIGLVTAFIAHRRLTRRGATYWDEVDGLEVHEQDVSSFRVAVAALVLVLSVIAVALSFAA